FVAKNVGLPQPVKLDRWTPGSPVVTGEVLLGAAPGGWLATPVARVLADIGATTRTGPGEVRAAAGEAGLDAGVWNPDAAGEGDRFKALVFDASGISDSTQLRELWAFFHPTIRRVERSGRIIVLGTPPENCDSPRAATAQRALEGFTRSAGKEVRTGAAVTLVYGAPGGQA